MANLAQIQSIAQGQFFVKDSLGNLTELKVGDTVSLNDTIVAASSNTDLSKIEILFDTNELITLSQGEQLLDTTLLASTFGNEELAFDKQEVDETLNAWNNAQDGDETDMETAAGDVTEQATNAGDERAADGGALRSKFNSRDGASTNVESDLRDTSFGGGNTENPQEQIPTELLNPVDTRVPASVITLSDPIVKEGNQITIVATVTNPPQTDLIITLNNGQTITIPAGQTTGTSEPFTNPNSEDVYKDGSTLNYAITGTTGGNYVSLDTSDSSVVTIEDTENTTTVTLTGGTVNENAETATFTIKLSNAYSDFGGTTATVKVDGETQPRIVTIDANGEGTFKVNTKNSDVWNDGQTISATVTGLSKDTGTTGGFEAVDYTSATATVTVNDTDAIDTTTVTLTGGTVNENAETATFTIKLSNAYSDFGGTTATVKVDGETQPRIVTIDANGEGTFKVNTKNSDVWNDGQTISATVTGLSKDTGTTGGFEAVDYTSATATVTVNDTDAIDTTTVTIEPIVTSSNTIDILNINDKASGYKVDAYSSYTDYANKTKGDISIVGDATAFGNAVRGFGVQGDDASNGDERELGKGEAIVIDFEAKDILSVDVSLAWRNQDEKAEITFLDKNGNKVGSASLTGGKNGNLEATSTITYKDASGHQIGNPITIQGGSDGIDKPFELKLPNGQLFNKVVFTAPGTNDDYLINSIQYKEVVVDNSSSVITGNGEVVFKIETSNKPDPSKYDDANPPKAKVEIQISGSSEIITKEVTLDREGKGTVLVQADGTKTITAKVTEIIGGNFEAVDYSSAKSTITVGTTNPTAGNDKIDVVEDTAYTLQISDFGNTQTDVAKIQFKDLPSIDSGKLYILNSLVTSSTNERADYTQTDSGKVFVAVNVGDIVDITQIQQGNVIFVPKENSDVDGRFTFQVGDGNGKWSTPYNTEIIVKAVADAPTVSIDVTKIGATTITEDKYPKDVEGIKKLTNNHDQSKISETDGDDVIIIENQTTGNGANKEAINTLAGNDIVYIGGQLAGNNQVILGAGNDYIYLGEHFGGNSEKTYIDGGDGNDSIYLNHYTKSDWDTNKDSINVRVKNFENIKFKDGFVIGDSSKFEKTTIINEYKVDISASLTDTDRSEKLSDVTLKNIPEGSKLFGADGKEINANDNGTYTVKVDENGEAKLSLTNEKEVSDTDLNSIKASATSIEDSNGDSATTTVSQNLGKDIDLSGLKSILEEQKTGDIDLSKNGSQDKLTLTLDDVLKLSGDDDKIKITGDEFDSVAFKNTIGENGQAQTWSKAENSIVEDGKTFEVYTNSGDESLKVKVEQPISDGITN